MTIFFIIIIFIIVVYRDTFLAAALIFSSTEGLGSVLSQTTVTIRVKTQNKTNLPPAFNICSNPPLNESFSLLRAMKW